MKKTVIIFSVLSLCVFASCNNTPKNSLAVFEFAGEPFYLTYVGLLADVELEANNYVDIENIDSTEIYIDFIWGNYPKKYHIGSAVLYINPENNSNEIIETGYGYVLYCRIENDEIAETELQMETAQFENSEYANDKKLLEEKILQYYLENKEKTER